MGISMDLTLTVTCLMMLASAIGVVAMYVSDQL